MFIKKDGYEYSIYEITDNSDGRISGNALQSVINKYAQSGWRLAFAFTNEIGRTESSYTSSYAGVGESRGKNASIDQNFLIFERAVNSHIELPVTIDGFVFEINALMSLNKWDEAEELSAIAIQKYPNNADLCRQQVQILLRTNDYHNITGINEKLLNSIFFYYALILCEREFSEFFAEKIIEFYTKKGVNTDNLKMLRSISNANDIIKNAYLTCLKMLEESDSQKKTNEKISNEKGLDETIEISKDGTITIEQFNVLENKCTGCRYCADLCSSIVRTSTGKYHIIQDTCTHCGDCKKLCKYGAITSYEIRKRITSN